ncbi:MAG: RecQ family ATP-dependent DNA helicase [Akkermansiaceae bacterium]|nr:RecQ family ATP-dependent DNA helicase [Akkermansiaceae bacterium]MCP5550208.1 RecQ family ATP-dependent DNA helicase [Akkermansiaceae bacterium]
MPTADPAAVLSKVFGHAGFRPGQREVVDVLLAGRPALAVFPTGGGKSLCYQLPALLLDGLTLVVSPLIALMKDQVEVLVSRGVAAARLDSTLEAAEAGAIHDRMADGSLRLLYVAPERLANEGFLQKLRRTRLAMLAIDEAHCISEWGHNFRPDYLKLANLARELGVERVLALTATATPKVAADIRGAFGIREADHVRTGFRRPNLSYRVTPCAAGERKGLLLSRLRELPAGSAAVVYVTLQRTAEEVAGFLEKNGLRARAYHAGLADDWRARVQDDFMAGAVDIVVATIAFGMGIDKADVRAVFHYNLPKSLENYAQESGRAGRDGKPSVCEILACGDDRIVLENFVYGDTPSGRAVRSLVEHVLLQGERFSVSRHDLSAAKDIRPLVVATALTYLELKGVIESTGPFYAGYQVRFLRPEDKILAGHTSDRQRFLRSVFGAAKQGRTWLTIDVDEVGARIGEPPERIRRALNYLVDLGDVAAKPSGLRHGYRLAEGGPREVSGIAAELGELFARRESGEIERLGLAIGYCETGGCLTRRLLAYFGEEMDGDCGDCGNCRDGNGAKSLPCGLPDELSADRVAAMRTLADEGHASLRQPRQLARFLCGISSPATTRERLNRDDRFGLLEEVPFLTVLAQAESMGLR